MSRRNTSILRAYLGKTISGIVETNQDEDEGRLQIQFTDGTAVEFQADSNSGNPWLNVDPVETQHGLPERRPDPDAFAEKVPTPPGFEQGARALTKAYDDEWIGGTSTEAGNPVQDRDLPPGAETAEYRESDDNKPFHPVDVVDFDELG